MAVPWALASATRSAQEARALVVERPARKTPRCLLLAHGRRLGRCSEVGSCLSSLARPTINLHTRRIDDGVSYALRFEQTVSQ
jgi:hypothetical protein